VIPRLTCVLTWPFLSALIQELRKLRKGRDICRKGRSEVVGRETKQGIC